MTIPPLPLCLQAQLDLPPDSRDLTVPHFAALYRRLLHDALNVDSESKLDPRREREEEDVKRRLERICIDMAKDAILVRMLRELCVTMTTGTSVSSPRVDEFRSVDRGEENGIDERLRQEVYLMAEYLSFQLSRGAQDMGASDSNVKSNEHGGNGNGHEHENQHEDQMSTLMRADIEQFEHDLPVISQHLEQAILDTETTVRAMLDCLPSLSMSGSNTLTRNQTPSHQSNHLPQPVKKGVIRQQAQLPHQYQYQSQSQPSKDKRNTSLEILNHHLSQRKHTSTVQIPALLSTITNQLQTLSEQHSTLLRTQIQTLETHTHSRLSRHILTKASHLSTVSQGLSLKTHLTELLHERTRHSQPGIREKLQRSFDQATQEERDLIERESKLRALLAEYGSRDDDDDDNLQTQNQKQNENENSSRKKQIFQTLGREYTALEREIEEMKEDIQRLKGVV